MNLDGKITNSHVQKEQEKVIVDPECKSNKYQLKSASWRKQRHRPEEERKQEGKEESITEVKIY